MRSKDILKKALLNYDGTLIAVSHDREFLDGLVTKVYEFENHKIREHLGGIYEFLSRKKLASMADLERKSTVAATSIVKEETSNKQAFLNKKEYDRDVRKIETRIEKAELRISEIETEIAEYEAKIANPEGDLDALMTPEFYSAYTSLHTALKEQMSQWEELHKDLEEHKSKRI
jgi:ATP-binding cassette subfamily F protein 3